MAKRKTEKTETEEQIRTADINSEFLEANDKKEYLVRFIKTYIGKFGNFYAGKEYTLDKNLFNIFNSSKTIEEVK